MVKVWIHRPGGAAPLLAIEVTMADCLKQFDLADATYLRRLDPSQPLSPPPLAADTDPELVVFEVLDEDAGYKTGYYKSTMAADTVEKLLHED